MCKIHFLTNSKTFHLLAFKEINEKTINLKDFLSVFSWVKMVKFWFLWSFPVFFENFHLIFH